MDQPSSTSAKSLQSVGSLVDKTKAVLMKRKMFFLTIAFIPSFLQYLSTGIGQLSTAAIPFASLIAIASGVLSLFATIAIILALPNESMTDWKAAYQQSASKFWSLLLVVVLVGIVTLIGYLLFIPGIYVSVLFIFASLFNILEDKKGWKAATASQELVKGYWWPLFGRFLVYVLLALVYSFVIGLVFGLIGQNNAWITGIASLIISTTLTPFGLIYIYLLFKEMKSIKPKKSEAMPS